MIFRHLLNMRSHPTWVRGLKLFPSNSNMGCGKVAPYVGAWIETRINMFSQVLTRSHPTWVRGLKLLPRAICFRVISRTLRGCVD